MNFLDFPFTSESPPLAELVDLKEIGKLFRYFSVVTGLDVALFDFSGREILARRKEDTVCKLAENCRKCRKHISYGGLMSQDLGEPYICSCGCGLIMCFSPVMLEERLIGIIACGPALLWEADEVAVSEFIEKTRDMDINADVQNLLRSAASCSCVNMTSTSQLLFITVNSITREHSVYLKQRAQITMQQRRIAELLIDRKNSGGEDAAERKGGYPAGTEKELIEAAQSGNREQSKRILNLLLGEIFSFANGNMNTIRARLFELVAFFSRAAGESGASMEEVNGIIENSFRMFDDDAGFEKLCFLAGEALEGFIATVSLDSRRKYSRHLARAMEYIAEHYADDITLHSVADAVYISEFYLSHLFRKEMDTTFSDYVSRVRIDKAKTILKKVLDIRIQELSEIVGFNDANYFTKSFRKLTGQSPREYQSAFMG